MASNIKNFSNKYYLLIAAIWLINLLPGALTDEQQKNETLNDQLVLRTGSKSFEWWSKPPPGSTLKVYVFNITNFDAFLNEGKKPILVELGPYVYKTILEKRFIEEYENGTLSFNQKKRYEFDEKDSNGSEFDMIITPNIPMFGAISKVIYGYPFHRLGTADLLRKTDSMPFLPMSVKELLWGFEYALLQVAKNQGTREDDQYGIFYGSNGTSEDEVTIHSGTKDINKIGIIENFNDAEKKTNLFDKPCNNLLNRWDGSIFPPNIKENSMYHIYDKVFCRLVPFGFEKEVKDEPAAFRFTPVLNVFEPTEQNRKNQCYCPNKESCKNGMFNISSCNHEYPLLLSFPHFYLTDDVTRMSVEGVSPPDKDKHQYFIDIEPITGATIKSRKRLQINMATVKHDDFPQVKNIPDTIFPIIWFEESFDGVPQYVKDIVMEHNKHTTTTTPPKTKSHPTNGAENSVKILKSLIVTLTSISLMFTKF